jgi:hypothetical protein
MCWVFLTSWYTPEHPNTRYNAATVAFEYNNACTAGTLSLLQSPKPEKQTHVRMYSSAEKRTKMK